MPIALISRVDRDRQWFKSCLGLDTRESPRDVSFCAHAVVSKAPLIVPDALRDDRFADNSAVVGEPRVRFYAGAPLVLPDGACVGTLCVVDHRPRDLTDQEVQLLTDLADLAPTELLRAPPANGS